jgi:hypothetical protein
MRAEWHTADITAILRLASAGSKLTAKTKDALSGWEKMAKAEAARATTNKLPPPGAGQSGGSPSNALGRAKFGPDR